VTVTSNCGKVNQRIRKTNDMLPSSRATQTSSFQRQNIIALKLVVTLSCFL